MNKSKKSFKNAIAALLQMLVSCVIGLVLNRTIISQFGSDYNGINATASQIVNALMVLEGGFTLASNVALFAPFAQNDKKKINSILSATSKRFYKVGALSVIVGLLIAFAYPHLVNSLMPASLITALMLTVIAPACFNLGISIKYRVVILADQKEYVISLYTVITYLIGNCLAIVSMRQGASILTARVILMFSLFFNYLLIMYYCKRRYPFVHFNETPDYASIKGTKSVLILKITSMFYSFVPIMMISTLPGTGTLIASVYSVYRSVIAVVQNVLSSFTNAPRLSFGALFAEHREKDVERLFAQYEIISCIALSVILGTTSLLLMPFVYLYTSGVSDIDYQDKTLAVIMIVTVFFEILHIPSGQMIQMKGDFIVSRKIQSAGCILLVVTMIIGRVFFGLYGIVSAVMVTAILLFLLETWYTGRKIFHRTIRSYLKSYGPGIFIIVPSAVIGLSDVIICSSYISFIAYGIIFVLILLCISCGMYYIFSKKEFMSVTATVLKLVNNMIHFEINV